MTGFENKKQLFMELLDGVYPKLERFAYSISGSRDDAKDIISETILQAYENFEKLKKHESFLSFVLTIARRTKIKYFRKSSKTYSMTNEVIDEMFSNAENAEKLADIKILYAALDKLSEKLREVVVLHEIFGFKLKEICEIQKASLPAVKVRLHRAKTKLRKLLGAEIPENINSKGNFIEAES